MEIRQYKKGDVIKSYRYDNGRLLATIEIAGVWRSNPPESELLADGWAIYTPEPTPPYVPTYEEKVVALIREKYNENDELKFARWSRHLDTLTDEEKAEIEEFDAYVEWCHEEAKKNEQA